MNLNAPHVLAGDTNVSIDLAQGSEWVLDAVSTIRRRLPDSTILVPPPTVSEELAWLADHAAESTERRAAHDFLRQHRTWGFRLLLTSDQHLRAVDFQRVTFELGPFELMAPVIQALSGGKQHPATLTLKKPLL